MGSQTLKQFLKKQDPRSLIYVGTKDGSGWIVIEPASVMLLYLNLIDSTMKDKSISYRHLVEKKKRTIESNIERNAKEIDSVLATNSYDYYDSLLESRKDLIAQYNGYSKRLETLDKFLKKDYKLSSRKIIEVYDKKEDIPGIAVLVEGNELGDMWFKGEKTKMEFTKRDEYEN